MHRRRSVEPRSRSIPGSGPSARKVGRCHSLPAPLPAGQPIQRRMPVEGARRSCCPDPPSKRACPADRASPATRRRRHPRVRPSWAPTLPSPTARPCAIPQRLPWCTRRPPSVAGASYAPSPWSRWAWLASWLLPSRRFGLRPFPFPCLTNLARRSGLLRRLVGRLADLLDAVSDPTHLLAEPVRTPRGVIDGPGQPFGVGPNAFVGRHQIAHAQHLSPRDLHAENLAATVRASQDNCARHPYNCGATCDQRGL